MLEITGICKKYRDREILRGVELSMKRGECLGIVGRNGCGKTTLLSILAGARNPDGGMICFNGKNALEDSRLFREYVAYVPQENPLLWDLSVRDNMTLWYRGDRTAMKKDMESGAPAILGISSMPDLPVSRLSGGMKKRLSIACALAGHAPLLVMDEPGAALDMECKAAIREYIREHIKNGGSVILTSHEMEELSVCTSISVLRGGVLVPVDPHISEEELVNCFSGDEEEDAGQQ